MASARRFKVRIRTAYGEETRDFVGSLRLIDVCRLLRIPAGAVSLLAIGRHGSRRVTGLFDSLELVLEPTEELVLQFDRNINYLTLLTETPSGNGAESASETVVEYILPSEHQGYATPIALTVDVCRSFVFEAVKDFVDEHTELLIESRTIVVGASGGGDSNALLTALARATVDLPVEIVPVMLLGLPEWDEGVPRAEQLCDDLDLRLLLVESGEVNQALGRPEASPDWLGEFKKYFPDDDHDVIGTLAVRLALSRTAEQLGTRAVVTGLNLEDILAECLLRVVQGKLPLNFPVRRIDALNLLYPIYRVPKKILDGCHPDFALANYSARSIGVMPGRAIPYYLAQSLNSVIPGVEFDLVEGFRRLPHADPVPDKTLGFAILDGDDLSDSVRSRWMQYLHRS